MPKIKQSKIQPTTSNFKSIFNSELELVSGSGTSFTITGTTEVADATSYYASASDVAGLCRNLLGSEANFSISSSPSLTAVNDWLSSGYGIINTRIATDGYTTPVSSGTTLYSWLHDLNALFGAARAEMSRTTFTLAPGERTRGQVFEDLFWKQLDKLCNMDLTTVGAVNSLTGIKGQTMFVGGTSKASKSIYKQNEDRVEPKFSKGMFNMPGTVVINSAESEDD